MNETVNLSEPPAADDIVAEIWERTLDVPALRGDHLLDVLANQNGIVRAIQVGTLFDEIAAATGVHLPLSVALGSPTASDIARMVRTSDWPAQQRPIMMQSGMSGQSLFCLPGVGGLGLDALRVVGHLSFFGPVYFNPPQGLDGAEPHRTLDTLVADHADLIRKVQPNGPYWLLGYSWGGLVALEIARCLRDAGESIAFLGMIDPVMNQADWPYTAWLGYIGARIRHHVVELRQIGSTLAAIRYGTRLMLPVFDKIVRPFGINRFWPLESAGKELPPALARLWATESEIIKTYRLRHYEGAVTLFAMQDGNARDVEPEKVWPPKVDRFRLQWVPGDHELTEPDVWKSAQAISATIAAHGE